MRTAVAPSPRTSRTRSIAADLARMARAAAATKAVGFGKYRGKPVDFQREILGYTPIEPQARVLGALQREDRVAVPSGRAMGKSRLDAGAALHFAATEGPNALVVLLAPTFRQIQVILWEELRCLYFNARTPFGGECAKLASTGLRLPDGSRIFGITGDKPEALQGIRAPRMLVIADEASGIEDSTFTALEGNLAGGGKMLLTGNPTHASGHFREACRSERYEVVHLPSTASPNVVAKRVLVPGLATQEWIEERAREWGEDSAMFKIHVLGQFVELEEGRLFSEKMIADAENRWHDEPARGRLVLGVDPAGDGGDGDETAIASRRGKKILGPLYARRGLTADAHVVEVMGLIKAHGSDGRPLVVVDRDGYVGAKVYAALAGFQSQNEEAFELVGVRGGERARRRPREIDRVRDEVWLNLFDSMRLGLAIPEDLKLSRDLAAIRTELATTGRTKIISKDDLRKELGRSPDRGDAVSLAAWGSDEESEVEAHGSGSREGRAPDPYEASPEEVFDPFRALERWR